MELEFFTSMEQKFDVDTKLIFVLFMFITFPVKLIITPAKLLDELVWLSSKTIVALFN